MDIVQAIDAAEKGKRLTNPSLPHNAVMTTSETGNLIVLFPETGDCFDMQIRAEHRNDDWQIKVEGWASYD